VRIYHYVMPFYQLRAGGSHKTLGNHRRPLWAYRSTTTRAGPLTSLQPHRTMSYDDWQAMEHNFGRGIAEDFIQAPSI